MEVRFKLKVFFSIVKKIGLKMLQGHIKKYIVNSK